MKKISVLVLAIVSLAVASCKKEEETKKEETPVEKTEALKIVSLNGAVTEIIAALGHEKEIVGVDVTSTYPETVKTTAKDLGHVRSITIESIVALKPTVIIGTDKDMSPELAEKIKAAGIEAHILTQDFSPEGTKKLIADVAGIIKNTDFKALTDKIDADLAKVQPIAKAPKVLFIYARGAGTLMVAGKNTPVEKTIALAGGQNAVTEFDDFKPLTPESLIKGNPDVILLFTTGLQSLGGVDGLLKIQGVEKTNAGKNKKIIALDGALISGFGPRVGEGAAALNAELIKATK
ncbi:MAG: ABC transporter substrate-binding protein [Flavobacterium sp.]|uniref:heme/hemin ABC transporter substrate-binding protein n=1 Tax=Flavobacterium sp. Leaf359 TaxID=1736351 RepID=UPI0006F4769F|nr:ABC transporter substrate-binding protein [Flavobacterium sp. Leaf359]KQS52667.1 ABC transporter substrate-binding protein [Flavobacterium sp. Leaf359]MBU7570091.1 ABC transporter substrate-binding protein [Flavobacterium sp.]PZO31120.1 MAG: hemin ABC transporter substrate-binding protein [Flavobacteriaceae bacterium]